MRFVITLDIGYILLKKILFGLAAERIKKDVRETFLNEDLPLIELALP